MRTILFLLSLTLCFPASDAEWAERLGGKVERNAQGDVTGLNLRASWVSDADLAEVAKWKKLERLDLSLTRVTDQGLLLLKELENVRELNLFYAELVTDEGLAVVRNWKKLEDLNCRGTKVTDNTLTHIAGLRQLKKLDVGFAEVTDNGLYTLTRLDNLEEVSIGGNKLTDNCLRFLRNLPKIRKLDVSGQQRTDSGLWFAAITDAGLEIIAQSPSIESLNLAGAKISDLGIAKLAKLERLRELNLNATPITSKGLAALAALPHLEKLYLWKTAKLDASAAEPLLRFKSLRWIDLKDSGAAGIAASLRKANIASPE